MSNASFLGIEKYPISNTDISTVFEDLLNNDEELIKRIKSVRLIRGKAKIVSAVFYFMIYYREKDVDQQNALRNKFIEILGISESSITQQAASAITGKFQPDKYTEIRGEIAKYGSLLATPITIDSFISDMKKVTFWGSNNPKRKNILLDDFIKTITGDEQVGQIDSDDVEDGSYLDDIENALSDYKSRQIIFTGAPGTGKTYSIRECIKKLTKNDDSRMEFVQFHASYDYTDFVEGLRPVKIGGSNTFVRLDGKFKAFCRRIVEHNLDIISAITSSEIDTTDKLFELMNSDSESSKRWALKIEDEVFKSRENQYYFVVDEINRADIGKVFGELMYGLEMSYRGIQNRFSTQYSNLDTYIRCEEKGENGKTYISFKPISEIKEDVFEKGFFIPENLHIVGTMNDIDRSVETFDFALRRRFKWKKMEDVVSMESILLSIFKEYQNVPDFDDRMNELIKRVNNLNAIICDKDKGGKLGLNEAFQLGPIYFSGYDMTKDRTEEGNNYKIVWDEDVEPILKEYVRGRDFEAARNFINLCRGVLVDGNEAK